MQRKPGGYRTPTESQRSQSKINKDDFNGWFRQFWSIPGASTASHPAPYPLELAYRLVRMFSFTGDTVLDPFCGTGTTMIAAMKCDRNSIGVEVDSGYCAMAAKRLLSERQSLFSRFDVEMLNFQESRAPGLLVREPKAVHKRPKRTRKTTRSSE
jgi:site-specific DNA-methyltransferase (adenine-specific)